MLRTALIGALCLGVGFFAGVFAAPTFRPSEEDRLATDDGAQRDLRAAGGSGPTAPERRAAGELDGARLASLVKALPKLNAPAPAAAGGTPRPPVSRDQLPAKVEATLHEYTRGKTPEKLAIEERRRNGRAYYNMEFEVDAVSSEIDIDEDGKVMAWETDVAIPELPPTIISSIAAALPGGVPVTAELEHKEGRTIYEIDVRQDGRMMEIQIGEDGKVKKVGPK